MKTARLTLKNYRGFSDQSPATVEIGGGLTALLGPNNAGKSSLKLLFYELRALFGTWLNGVNSSPSLLTNISGQAVSINYPDTSDPTEIFNNSNERDITVEIEVLDPTQEPGELQLRQNAVRHVVHKLVATCARNSPNSWHAKIFSRSAGNAPLKSPNGYTEANVPFCYYNGEGSQLFDCRDLLEIVRAFRDARYYGAFRNTLNQGSSNYYDFQIGTAFIDLWNNWKTAGNKSHSRAITKITEEIRRLFDFRQLEINASVSLKTLLVTIDGNQYRLGEMGSGISQFIMALGNAATSAPSIILIDEPETNLHPALQIDFLLTLAQYASVGCVFSTHSVGLARSVATSIFTVQKGNNGPVVRPFEATHSYAEFLGELSFSAFRDMGCDRILLVEGVNDVKAVQQLLRLVGKEHTTVILPLGGDQLVAGGREHELEELKRLSENVYALVDSERPDASAAAAQRRVQFEQICNRIGFGVCVTQKRALENYFPDSAVKAAFGASFSALGPYDRLDQHPNGWAKSDNWKIAHHVKEEDLMQTDVGRFLSEI
ncbi:ATP-dependent nuclease [Bradyrhizobium sp. BWC-3-1]|uniref:ATP-dependent nuclease n=1 Tax=Bradyrhizobium sp. BWC-3-1 TaxID=3080012 RepID=UPI00293E61DE|nr:AAA family ATPase [Bradyrhizobium sp. BWC-3-1]WOH59772.1 AAA family ATPase [Bradyrhizobium sp. BWC-3-1]